MKISFSPIPFLCGLTWLLPLSDARAQSVEQCLASDFLTIKQKREEMRRAKGLPPKESPPVSYREGQANLKSYLEAKSKDPASQTEAALTAVQAEFSRMEANTKADAPRRRAGAVEAPSPAPRPAEVVKAPEAPSDVSPALPPPAKRVERAAENAGARAAVSSGAAAAADREQQALRQLAHMGSADDGKPLVVFTHPVNPKDPAQLEALRNAVSGLGLSEPRVLFLPERGGGAFSEAERALLREFFAAGKQPVSIAFADEKLLRDLGGKGQAEILDVIGARHGKGSVHAFVGDENLNRSKQLAHRPNLHYVAVTAKQEDVSLIADAARAQGVSGVIASDRFFASGAPERERLVSRAVAAQGSLEQASRGLPVLEPERGWYGKPYVDATYAWVAQKDPNLKLEYRSAERLAPAPMGGRNAGGEETAFFWIRQLTPSDVGDLARALHDGTVLKLVDPKVPSEKVQAALKAWILAQKDESIAPHELLGKAILLSNGDVFQANVELWNLMRKDWSGAATRNANPIHHKLLDVTGEFPLRDGAGQFVVKEKAKGKTVQGVAVLPNGKEVYRSFVPQLDFVVTKRGDKFSAYYHFIGTQLLSGYVADRMGLAKVGELVGKGGALAEMMLHPVTAGSRAERIKRVGNDIEGALAGAELFRAVSKPHPSAANADPSSYLKPSAKFGAKYQLEKDGRPPAYFRSNVDKKFWSGPMTKEELIMRLEQAIFYDRRVMDPMVLATSSDGERMQRGLQQYVLSGARDRGLNDLIDLFNQEAKPKRHPPWDIDFDPGNVGEHLARLQSEGYDPMETYNRISSQLRTIGDMVGKPVKTYVVPEVVPVAVVRGRAVYGKGDLPKLHPAVAQAVHYSDAVQVHIDEVLRQFFHGQADADKVDSVFRKLRGSVPPEALGSKKQRALTYIAESEGAFAARMARATADGDEALAARLRGSRASAAAQWLGMLEAQRAESRNGGQAAKDARRSHLKSLDQDDVVKAYGSSHFDPNGLDLLEDAGQRNLYQVLRVKREVMEAEALEKARQALGEALRDQVARGPNGIDREARARQMERDLMAAHASVPAEAPAEQRQAAVEAFLARSWSKDELDRCVASRICVSPFGREPLVAQNDPNLLIQKAKLLDALPDAPEKARQQAFALAELPPNGHGRSLTDTIYDLDTDSRLLKKSAEDLREAAKANPALKAVADDAVAAHGMMESRIRQLMEEKSHWDVPSKPGPHVLEARDNVYEIFSKYLQGPETGELVHVDQRLSQIRILPGASEAEVYQKVSAFQNLMRSLSEEKRGAAIHLIGQRLMLGSSDAAELMEEFGWMKPHKITALIHQADSLAAAAGRTDPALTANVYKASRLDRYTHALIDIAGGTKVPGGLSEAEKRGAQLAALEKAKAETAALEKKVQEAKGRDLASVAEPRKTNLPEMVVPKAEDSLAPELRDAARKLSAQFPRETDALARRIAGLVTNPDMKETYELALLGAVEHLGTGKKWDEVWEEGVRQMLRKSDFSEQEIMNTVSQNPVLHYYQRTAKCLNPVF